MKHDHYRSEEPDRSFLVWMCLIVAVVLACASAIARAEATTLARAVTPAAVQPAVAQVETLDSSQLIWAARACYLEASFRESDCIALLYVVQKRANRVNRSWVDVLRAYSAINANNARAKEVREYPWADIPGKPEPFNERWLRLRELVSEFADGQHADPCPRAEHWGGSMDHARGRMVPARCAASMANTFYAVKKR
jgi:hypothetical protein